MRFIFLCLCITLASCTKNKVSDEKVLHLLSIGKVSGFDPALGGDQYTSAEMGKVFEGLYEFHPTKRPYVLIPNLAEDLPTVSKDGLTYTFTLKKGVRFHDDAAFKEGKGRELKASDVIYSIKRLADPKLHARGWWLFDERVKGLNEWREKHQKSEKTNYDEEISGLKLIDDYRFALTLSKPFPQLLYAFAMPFTFAVAREVVETYGAEFLNHPVGTGPFILPKYEQSNRIVYTKNPNYREKYYPVEDQKLKVPGVDKFVVDIITESQPAWLAFQRGKLDYMGIPKDYFGDAIDENNQLKQSFKDKGIWLMSRPSLDVTFIAFNHENPIFKNVKLRRAMSMAINRAEENKLFYNNTAVVAQGLIPPGMGGYKEDFKNPYVEFNLDLAKKLLKEAGYPDGKGLPELTLETGNSTTDRQMAEFMAKEMSKLGIKIKMGANTWPELVNKVSHKNFQLYTMAWNADYPDAENFLGLLYCPNKSPGINGSNYCNPKFDELFRKSTQMQDSPERTALYEKLNQMVALEVPIILSFHRTKYHLVQGWVKNYEPMEFNHSIYQYLEMDVKKKQELMEKY